VLQLKDALLFNRISLIPQTSTTILPLVGIGGSLVVESRKNGQIFRGIIWWDYLVGSTGFSRPPAHPPVAAPPRALPRALGSDHPAPHRGAPFAARSLCFVAAGQRTENRSFIRDSVRFDLLLKLQMIPPRKLPTSKPTSKDIFRRCQQMASHLTVAPLPRATAPSSPMICRRQPS
jgi:hypothetical protein